MNDWNDQNNRLKGFVMGKKNLSIVLIFTIIVGCDIGLPIDTYKHEPEETPEMQTEILAVFVEKDTINYPDSTKITCMIEDSTDHSFEFEWGFEGPGDTVTKVNYVYWQAPKDTGMYKHIVLVDNGNISKISPTETFRVYVKKTKQKNGEYYVQE